MLNPDYQEPLLELDEETKSIPAENSDHTQAQIQSLDDMPDVKVVKVEECKNSASQDSSGLQDIQESKGEGLAGQGVYPNEVKLIGYKAKILGWDTAARSIDANGSACYTACTATTSAVGFLATVLGGALSLGAAIAPNFGISSDGRIGLGVLTGVGVLLLIPNIAFCFSSKCRAYTMRKINKPLTTTFISISELNEDFKCLGVDPVDEQKIETTRDLMNLTQILDLAVDQANPAYQCKIGKEVTSTLANLGFFAEGTKIVLQYLIPDPRIEHESIQNMQPKK